MDTGWVTEPGWRYTYDALGWIDSAYHVCESNQGPVRATFDVEKGRFVCSRCGDWLDMVKVQEEDREESMAMYDGLTREELIEALEKMGPGYERAVATAEELRLINLSMRDDLAIAQLGEQRLARELQDLKKLRSITLRVSASLARAWTDMIEYLHD